jgi:hypothetical protein
MLPVGVRDGDVVEAAVGVAVGVDVVGGVLDGEADGGGVVDTAEERDPNESRTSRASVTRRKGPSPGHTPSVPVADALATLGVHELA